MKTIYFYLKNIIMSFAKGCKLGVIVAAFGCLPGMFSCSSYRESDDIGASTEYVELNASIDSFTINTKKSGWWIGSIIVNEKVIKDSVTYSFYDRFSEVADESDTVAYTHDWFTIEKRGPKSVFVKVAENSDTTDRTLKIYLTNGIHYSQLKITQNCPEHE